MTAARPPLVVAARSARLLAEAAAREGYEVIALDAFGDADTRRAARRWQSIAAQDDGQAPRIDPARLLDALAAAAHAGPIGWIAGSDLEADPALLEAGARILPLAGCTADTARGVRDPRRFFAALDALGLEHPETRFDPPADPRGWLRKDARGSGGWHIRRAVAGDAGIVGEGLHFQRESPGRPMSALFVAGPQRHRRVGLNELIVRPYGAHPHVYRGAIGPVELPAPAGAVLEATIDALVGHFGLRGLCSLDVLWHDGRCGLLEVNPRPSASMALYPELPLIGWHLQACGFEASSVGKPAARPGLRGIETVFARHAFVLGRAEAEALHARADCHDLPAALTRFAPGDPVCSVSAVGNNPVELHMTLGGKRQTLRQQFAAGAPGPSRLRDPHDQVA